MSKYGYIDKSGKFIIPPQFDTSGFYNDGIAAVEVDGKYGFIDKQGDFVIPLQFHSAYDFSEGLAAVSIDGNKYGYINKAGTVVIPPTFKDADYFSDGLALVRTKATDGAIHEHYIDTSGEKALTFTDDHMLYGFSEGLARHGVWNEETDWEDMGYIDRMGTIVIPPDFESISDFSEGYAYVKTKEGKRCFIDKTGQMVLESALIFYPPYFSEGLIGVNIDYQYGFADKSGSVVIEPRFDNVGDFSEGLAPAAVDAKYGYFDKSGEWVSDPTFRRGGLFVDAKYGYIDKSGEWVIEPRFKEAWCFSEGLALVQV